MIIHEIKKQLYVVCVLVFTILSTPVFAQQLQPAPTFSLLNAGYGAAALGMGGAFVAVANDLSAIYWNPAGVGQLGGFQIYGDYRYQSDSDEDFSPEIFANRFESSQSFAILGNQLQALSASYAIRKQRVTFVPAFAWQRTSVLGPKRDLKERAGVVEFLTPAVFFQSEGNFNEEINRGAEEYSTAFSVNFSGRILFGGSWSFLTRGPEENLTGTFHDSFVLPFHETRTDTDLSQTRKTDFSGNYFKVGGLYFPAAGFSIGGTVRFPYTRKATITLDRKGSFVTSETVVDADGNVIREVITSGALDEQAAARSELKQPAEFTVGAAMRTRKKMLVSGSLTYADWSDAMQIISDSTDPLLIPETELLFPTLRVTNGLQPSLLQWRGGVEYQLGQIGNGIALRAGIFRDGQPYGTTIADRVYFKGYSFGAGYASRGLRIDAAFVRETGDPILTTQSSKPSRYANRRWVFSVGYAQ